MGEEMSERELALVMTVFQLLEQPKTPLEIQHAFVWALETLRQLGYLPPSH
jgi:hypothetical protein